MALKINLPGVNLLPFRKKGSKIIFCCWLSVAWSGETFLSPNCVPECFLANFSSSTVITLASFVHPLETLLIVFHSEVWNLLASLTDFPLLLSKKGTQYVGNLFSLCHILKYLGRLTNLNHHHWPFQKEDEFSILLLNLSIFPSFRIFSVWLSENPQLICLRFHYGLGSPGGILTCCNKVILFTCGLHCQVHVLAKPPL